MRRRFFHGKWWPAKSQLQVHDIFYKLGNEGKGMQYFEYQNCFKKFCADMFEEQKRATEKFPGSDRLLGALMEEVGELVRALLKIQESGESSQRVYDEAIQVASTAYRLAREGEPDYKYEGMKCHYNGCQQVVIGGPCCLCYE